MSDQDKLATWKSCWKYINKMYGSPGQYGWDWPTLRCTYPQIARVLWECRDVVTSNKW